jgi:hypothetical protein
MDGLLGRTVLLTGANGGIGVVAVQRFLDSGANVVCQYRSSKKNLESLEEKVPCLPSSFSLAPSFKPCAEASALYVCSMIFIFSIARVCICMLHMMPTAVWEIPGIAIAG